MTQEPAAGHSAALGFLLLVNAFYFLPVLAQGNGTVLSSPGTDTWGQFFFWRHFAYEHLGRGEMPLWNPYIFSGTPFVAGIQSAIFYPLNLIHLVAPTALAINLNIALHCLLASSFTYLCAWYAGCGRWGALLAGISFAYGAPYFLHVFAGHLPHLSTMMWLPLLFLGLEMFLKTSELRYAVFAGIVLALQLFAGFPQYLFYSVIAVSLYFLSRLSTGKGLGGALHLWTGFALFLVTGVLLTAVQWLPTAEFTRNSFRENLSYEWVARFSLPPENLATLLIPDFFGNTATVPYWGENYLWEMSVYIGIVPLALAAIAVIFDRRGKALAFALIAATALILALGKHTPLLKILYTLVPGFDRFRGSAKFVFVFSFATAILAGFGLSRLSDIAAGWDKRCRRLGYAFLGFAVFMFILAIAGALSDREAWHSLIESYDAAEVRSVNLPPITEGFVQAAVAAAFRSFLASAALLALVGVSLLAIQNKPKALPYLPAAVVLLAVVDLWHFGSRYLARFSPEELRMDRQLKAFLMTDGEPYRIASPLDRIANIGVYEGIEDVGGYDTLMVKRYSEFLNFAQNLPVDQPNVDARVRAPAPLFNLLNMKYFIVDPSTRVEYPGLKKVFENSRYHVYRNYGALPRSFVVHDIRVLTDANEILRQMASPGFDPTSVAIVEGAIESLPLAANMQSPAPKFIERSLNRVVLDATLTAPGLLVLAEVFYPGWKCFVDGKENKIHRANYVMRGVVVPAGGHRVEFRFDPLSFKIGGVISVTTLLVISGWLFWSGRRKANGKSIPSGFDR